ncbi:MarR family transcriptional regulator [Streptomyces sp. WAC08241]|uniref:MarR family transcriptional regulator n=1 Tax=Streptomyces sp. WAC08241 TaxID=2487421 RepID=UPI00163C71E4|nr:MarR family transcriptional regulator [Streptomyces sp. WAC08241]
MGNVENEPNATEEGRAPEMVTLAEIARRVELSKQRVQQLAHRDPDFPIPKEQWQKVGRYYFLPWEPVKAYFEARNPQHGVHFAKREERRQTGESADS